MLPANELFSDGKLVPLQLLSVKRERAHPLENHIAHPPENHRPIVNPLARLDHVQGSGTTALSSLSLPFSYLAFVAGLGFFFKGGEGGGGRGGLLIVFVGSGPRCLF